MLRRTDTISEQDKQTVEEVISTMFSYEEIVQEDPIIQNLLAQRELEGEARGKAEGIIEGRAVGEIEGIRKSILNILSARFFPILAIRAKPAIMSIRAKPAIMSIQASETLNMLLRQLIKTPDEQSACQLLDLPDEQSHLGSPDLPTE
jgi:hypothetical protein